jgi:hypothetical protein
LVVNWSVYVGEPTPYAGVYCFCPVEAAPDGGEGVVVITGMNFLASLDEMKQRPGVERIYLVSRVEDLADARLVYDNAGDPA